MAVALDIARTLFYVALFIVLAVQSCAIVWLARRVAWLERDAERDTPERHPVIDLNERVP